MNKRRMIPVCLLTICVQLACGDGASDQRGNTPDSLYSGAKFNEHIRSTEAASPEDQQKGFKLPDGFEISLYASEPEIGKPINISFDARGRMWVTQSFEYPFAAAPGTGKDRVTILEDTDADGRADKFTHFNDTLNIPIGILPVEDGAMVYSIPNVYKYTDADNNGKADSGKKIMGPFEVKDTHGMVNNFAWGFDGWIHACHGYANKSTVAAADGDSIHLVSGNTIRFRPDGSRVEITTEGRINPFGLAFDERGYLYSTDCHTSPLYQLIRGGEYTQWGREEKMGFAPDMKPLEDEATALAGIAYYGDELFPEEFRKNFYIGDAVASRVYRNSSTWKGSSPVGKKEEPFVLSADPWFRPVDVKMGPDGAIYIADFYNSIIGHYEVPLDHPKRDRIRGRIWRITYNGKANKNQNLTTANTAELLSAFKSANIQMRLIAANQLVHRIGKASVQPVQSLISGNNISPNEYVHALWVLHRLDALNRETLNRSLQHKEGLIRLHALRVLREAGDSSAAFYSVVQQMLQDKDPHVQRAAVEAMSHYKNMASVEKLVAFRKTIPADDSHMIYTTRLTLRNLLRDEKLMRDAAVKKWQADDARVLSTVLVGVESPISASFMFNYLRDHDLPNDDLPRALKHVVRFVPAAKINEAVTMGIAKASKNEQQEANIFRNLRDGLASRGVKEPVQLENWAKQIVKRIMDKKLRPGDKSPNEEADALHFAAESAGNYKVVEVKEELADIFSDTSVRIYIRNAALRSMMQINQQQGAALAAQQLNDTLSIPAFKRDIVAILAEFPGEPVNKALASVNNAPPDLQQGIVMGLAGSAGGRQLLFEKVRKGAVFARTLTDPRVKERLLLGISPEQRRTYNTLTENLSEIDEEKQKVIRTRIADYNTMIEKPAPASGEVVFTKNCAPCHSIKGKGGAIGPQLDGVGRWGTEPLIEKILDPNRNISENFRNYTIKLKDGKILSGLYRRDEGQVIVFADAAGREFTVSKQEIADRTASEFSLMPDQFRNTIPVNEFYSLISYLLSQK